MQTQPCLSLAGFVTSSTTLVLIDNAPQKEPVTLVLTSLCHAGVANLRIDRYRHHCLMTVHIGACSALHDESARHTQCQSDLQNTRLICTLPCHDTRIFNTAAATDVAIFVWFPHLGRRSSLWSGDAQPSLYRRQHMRGTPLYSACPLPTPILSATLQCCFPDSCSALCIYVGLTSAPRKVTGASEVNLRSLRD